MANILHYFLKIGSNFLLPFITAAFFELMTEIKMIRLYHCRANNFGDAMNPILIERLTGQKCRYAGKMTADIIGIGSILNGFVRPRFAKKIRDFFAFPAWVWSSGFIKEADCPEYFRKNISFAALRGKISLKRAEKIVGRSLDVPLGDGGLLFYCMFDRLPAKKYSVGLTPHVQDLDSPVFQKLAETLPHSILINFHDEPLSVLRQIARCDFILSSSMHGLIAADSLGIPNCWLKASDRLTGGDYKFRDYYSVFDIEPQPLSPGDADGLTPGKIDELAAGYRVDSARVEDVRQNLLKALKDIC